MRLLARAGGVVLVASLISAGPAPAQSAADGAVARLLGEALQSWEAAGPGMADDLAGLRARAARLAAARDSIAAILRDHPDSAVARDLRAGREVRGLSRAKIERRLDETTRRIEVEDRAMVCRFEREMDRQLERNLGIPVPSQECSHAMARARFRDCEECPEMVILPSGRFVMGAAPGEEDEEDMDPADRGRSSPQVPVSIARSFAIGRFEVTRGEYAAFVRDAGEAPPTTCNAIEGGSMVARQGLSWRDPGFAQDPGHPVVCVSWHDAQRYVEWLSRRSGKPYRLPRESEWEYAARGGHAASRPWGGGREAACEHANILDVAGMRVLRRVVVSGAAPCEDQSGYTAPVGRYRANAFGLHDMIGNAWEWVAECWTASLSVRDVRSDLGCAERSMRGGAWLTFPEDARPAFRASYPADKRAFHIGFRVVRDM
jgi:formylglycine-generating enzyme required for sulfatase activity